MANIYRSLGDGMRKSSSVIFLFLLFSSITVASGFIMYEDFMTTYLGYLNWPTAKATNYVAFAVAFVITAGDIALGYAFMLDSRAYWKGIASLGFMFADAMFDVWFKTSGFSRSGWITAAASLETFFVFTLLSEMMFMFALGMTANLAPDALREIGVWFGKIGKALMEAIENMTGGSSDDSETPASNLGGARRQ